MHTGLILEPIQPDTGFLGGVGGELPDLIPDGNWEPFLPKFEPQNKLGLETLGCVSFSRLNASETQARFYGKPVDFSDRSLAWASGTTTKGNSYSAVDFWFRNRGACGEDLWPWDKPMTWEEYYSMPPGIVQTRMADLMDQWTIGMRVYVSPIIEDMKIALKKGPLWFCTHDHSMMMYRIDTEMHIFDSYANQGDGKRHWPLKDVNKIVSAYLVPFTPKELTPQPMITLPANSLVVVVDGHGERLMNVDGTKLYQDDAGKILLEVIARNAVTDEYGVKTSYNFPIIHVRSSDITGIPRVNLKGEPVV